jgi:amino acid transporter
MSFFSNFATSLSIISILTGVTGQFGPVAMVYGGPVSAVWGWPLVCLMSMAVALSMAEICSAYPTCGGLYFW